MAGAALELLREAKDPRFLGQIRKRDGKQVFLADPSDGYVERGEVRRVEMGVHKGQGSESVLRERARNIDNQSGYRPGLDGDRSGKPCRISGGRVGKRREKEYGPIESLGRGARHSLRDDAVGRQGQMGAVRFHRTHGEEDDDGAPIQPLNFFPGEIGESKDRHAEGIIIRLDLARPDEAGVPDLPGALMEP